MNRDRNDEAGSPVSSYQTYLPAVLQNDQFIGRFLLAFEHILVGRESAAINTPPKIISFKQVESSQSENGTDSSELKDPPGLEQVIDQIHTYLSPTETPEDFLPWLAQWVSLSLRNDWTVGTKRKFIHQIVSLYRLRGTKQGLKKILSLYLRSAEMPEKVDIFEFSNRPHYFQVQLFLPIPDPKSYWRQIRIAKAIIDQEKPAHTSYRLQIRVPTMRLTGHFFPVSLQAGKITAQIQDSVDVSKIRLSIKSKLGDEPVAIANQDPNNRSVTYTIPPEASTRQNPWYVVIDYFGEQSLSITLQISTESAGKTSTKIHNLSLQRPLQIITLTSNQTIASGNTILGTVPSPVEQH